MVQNKGIIFKAVPKGWLVKGEHLAIEDQGFDFDAGPPKDEITTKNFYFRAMSKEHQIVSENFQACLFDPYQRGRMTPPERKSYSPPFELGKPITNSVIANVLKSASVKFAEGYLVIGMIPMAEYSVISAEVIASLTAYSSLYGIGEPKKVETIFISAASGAFGQIVGQLAKHEGLTVLGSVGSDEKLDFIKQGLKFDGGFNYKKEKPADALARLAPNGVDICYENVGGEQLDATLDAMTTYGRIDERYGVKNMTNIVWKRLKMQGFLVGVPDMGPKYATEHQEKVGKWIHDGSFIVQQSVTNGIDKAVDGFLGMLRGETFGKAILTICELEIGDA
ncbi:MAG: hypothetical protein Q9173_004219 [Seirophora scorigena]